MQQSHIPEVMETKVFIKNTISRLLEEEDSDGVTYIIQYTFKTLEDFIGYRTVQAPLLQKKHSEKFGNDAVAFRTVMEVVSE